MIDILIADDHAIFVEALISMLNGTGEITVLGTASDGHGALGLVEAHPNADLLVLDISMPAMDGIETLAELRRRHSSIPVLMLTQESSGGTVARVMKAGASGYVLKTAGREEFIAAIRTVASGDEHISEAAKDALIARLTGRRTQGEEPPLTRRETEVLKLIALGKTTAEIGQQLYISFYTAETHRRNLLRKLGLKNAAALSRYAVEHGLTDE